FASIISNNLNIVMKFLTSITIILALPTMVASFYGMNVDLPFQHSPHAFFITLGIAVFLSTLTTIIFWKKRFF
ncbi:CorA family divalent cation transporter, partial [Peribacillus tepidiphilus]|uniref:CorA family divalent cation transporter n=1 Tax=Peribacillus tepidiphilus TaxID=2652445 RepID=UPI0035B501C4